jgi:hypothetical protein
VRGVEEGEEVVQHPGKVRAVGQDFVLDNVSEGVRFPHLGVVAEHEKEDAGKRHRDLVVPDLGIDLRGVCLLDRGIHGGHELRGAL